MDNIGYYIFVLVALIVAFLVVKKVASCLIKSAVSAGSGFGRHLLALLYEIEISSANIWSNISRSFLGCSIMFCNSASFFALGEFGIHSFI